MPSWTGRVGQNPLCASVISGSRITCALERSDTTWVRTAYISCDWLRLFWMRTATCCSTVTGFEFTSCIHVGTGRNSGKSRDPHGGGHNCSQVTVPSLPAVWPCAPAVGGGPSAQSPHTSKLDYVLIKAPLGGEPKIVNKRGPLVSNSACALRFQHTRRVYGIPHSYFQFSVWYLAQVSSIGQ